MKDTFILELPDSELARAEAHDHALVLRLAAAHVVRTDSGEHGYVQRLELWCLKAQWNGNLLEAIGRIQEAQLHVNGVLLRLRAPGRVEGAALLSLGLGLGCSLLVHASAIETRFVGPHGFRASLAC